MKIVWIIHFRLYRILIQKSTHHLTNTYSISLRKKKIARKVNEDFANMIHTFTFLFLFIVFWWSFACSVHMLCSFISYLNQGNYLFKQTSRFVITPFHRSHFSHILLTLSLNCSWAIFMWLFFSRRFVFFCKTIQVWIISTKQQQQ